MTKLRLELLKNDKIAVSFPYDKIFVAGLKSLASRRWNPAKTQWEVHLSHLHEIIQIFGIKDADVPSEILSRYKSHWKSSKLRLRLDTLQGQFMGSGMPREVLEQIDAETSFYLPGHRYSPKFKAKQWDGKRHLFTRDGMKFPSGLWPRIKNILDEHKVEYVTESDTTLADASTQIEPIKFAQPTIRLRDYQAKALKEAVAAGRGILQIATGGGKTLLAAHLIRELVRPTFFFVHTKDLLHQTARVLSEELGVEVGILGDGQVEIRDVTVATIQTAARVVGLTIRKSKSENDEDDPNERPTNLKACKESVADAIAATQVVIFDECHHVPADTFYKIAFKTPEARYRYGLSATPWRDDGHDLLLEAALGPKICAITCTDLIRHDYLVPPKIVMEKAPTPRFNRRGWAYADIYRAAIVENQARNRVIAAQARAWADEGFSILVLVAQIEHGKQLLEAMPEAQFAYGNLDSETRQRLLSELERKLHPILIATTLADEGLDIPTLNALILAGGGKSDTKAYQRIGRALRKADGKQTARIMDFFDPAPYLEDHSLARLALYRHEPGFEIETRGFMG